MHMREKSEISWTFRTFHVSLQHLRGEGRSHLRVETKHSTTFFWERFLWSGSQLISTFLQRQNCSGLPLNSAVCQRSSEYICMTRRVELHIFSLRSHVPLLLTVLLVHQYLERVHLIILECQSHFFRRVLVRELPVHEAGKQEGEITI